MGVRNLPGAGGAPDRARARPPPSRPPSSSAARSRPAHGQRRRSARSPSARLRPSIRPPAITVVGAVAALRERLAWFERAPLHGKRVVVTRARAQASGLAARLAELGAEVIEAPAIRIEPRLDPPRCARMRAALAAGELRRRLPDEPERRRAAARGARTRAGCDARALGRRRRSPRSARDGARRCAREACGRTSCPSARSRSRWPRSWSARGVQGKRVLVARAAEARDVLPDALRERGAEVDVVALYDTVREELDATGWQQLRRGRLRHLHQLVDRALLRSRRSAAPSACPAARASCRSAR